VARQCPRSRGWEPSRSTPACRAREHNSRNAAAAIAALELAGVPRGEAIEALAGFRGVGRRFEFVGEPGGVLVYDDYAHNPEKLRAALATARECSRGRVLVLFQPHLFSRTRHLAAELGRELAAADVVAVTEVYPAREQPVADVSGKLVVDACDARPGFAPAGPRGWRTAPRLSPAARPGIWFSQPARETSTAPRG
jgi:UDP-N-acetylmuramate--alanine ligase